MSLSPPKHIIFDIGGVVVRLNFEPSRRRIAEKCGISFAEVQALMTGKYDADGRLTFLARYVIGQISTDEYLNEVVERLGNCVTREALIADCRSDLPGVYPQTVALIESLRKEYAVSCFSNTHDLHWEYMLRTFPVFESFEHRMASHLAGTAKPLPECYAYMCQTLACDPDDALLIDDSEENIVAARAYGMHGIHYIGMPALGADLAKLGYVLPV